MPPIGITTVTVPHQWGDGIAASQPGAEAET